LLMRTLDETPIRTDGRCFIINSPFPQWHMNAHEIFNNHFRQCYTAHFEVGSAN